MDDEPGLLTRVVAYFRREVSADELEPYRRAGRVVYDLSDRLEELEAMALVEHGDPLAFPVNVQTAQLCGSIALALQLVADSLIEADFELDPTTAGYVDRSIITQATLFYGQVPRWVSRAHQALHNPSYRLDVQVPVPLPDWPESEGDRSYSDALLAATELLAKHSEPRVEHRRVQLRRTHANYAEVLGQVLAEARSALDYSRGLSDADDSTTRDRELVVQLRCAVERYYLAGQLAEMPQLATRGVANATATRARPGSAPLLPAPGQPGFDPWCLTDPRAVSVLRRNRDSTRELRLLWQADPDPKRTLAIKRQLDSALMRGDISIDAGHFSDCPWLPIYLVKRSVRIANRTVHPLDQLTLALGVEPGFLKPRFKREILTGPFFP